MSDEAPDRQARTPVPRARDGRLFEFIVGGCAIVLSVVSLFVAISANRTQERMLAASVWPSLLFSTSNATPDGATQIGFDLVNRGTGPARLRWVELYYGETAVAGTDDLLRLCCTAGREDAAPQVRPFTSGVQNRIVGADEWVHMLQLPRAAAPDPVWRALDRERFKMRMRSCYCSVLDDCWIFDSAQEDPEPVRRCPAPGKVLWQG